MVTLKHIAAGFIASCFVIAITADSADARRGGGGGGGGVRAGGGGGGAAMRAGGARGGFANAGARRAHASNPIARPGIGNRPGDGIGGNRPGWGNNRPGWGGNPGWANRPGYGWGAAAAAGAGLAYASSYGDGYYGGYDASYGDSAAIADCARRFRSYDAASQTYLTYDGRRVSCP